MRAVSGPSSSEPSKKLQGSINTKTRRSSNRAVRVWMNAPLVHGPTSRIFQSLIDSCHGPRCLKTTTRLTNQKLVARSSSSVHGRVQQGCPALVAGGRKSDYNQQLNTGQCFSSCGEQRTRNCIPTTLFFNDITTGMEEKGAAYEVYKVGVG